MGQTLTAVDGSIVETIAGVARLSWLPKAKGASLCDSRLHTQFKVLRGIPSRIDVTPANPVRIVTVTATPHSSRGKRGGGSTGPSCDGSLRIVTNRLDLPAELSGEIYRLRWLIETFFRMFKQLLGCRHLLTTKQTGVEVQVSFGIIACLLILLYTGRRADISTQQQRQLRRL